MKGQRILNFASGLYTAPRNPLLWGMPARGRAPFSAAEAVLDVPGRSVYLRFTLYACVERTGSLGRAQPTNAISRDLEVISRHARGREISGDRITHSDSFERPITLRTRVELATKMSGPPGIVANGFCDRERRPAAHGLPNVEIGQNRTAKVVQTL